ncbi:hypothetical protein AAY473_034563 [Plecturocebus cupreus]
MYHLLGAVMSKTLALHVRSSWSKDDRRGREPLPGWQSLENGEMGFHHVGQAGLKLLTSSDPTASVSQSAGITGVNHCSQPHEMS